MSYWSPTKPRNAHVLVVDENVDELKVLLATLRQAGCRTTLAFDALQGYRRATSLRVDLILMGVEVGTAADGFAVCRLLKADPVTADIPVIFVTSMDGRDERLKGLNAGAVDYIVKPCDPEEVLARVAIHLTLAERRRAAPRVPAASVRTNSPPAGDRSGSALDRALVQAVQRLVLDDLSRVPSLPSIAAHVATHEKRLSRVFKEQTGRTVFEFVREARLGEALRLLVQSEMRIEEIALAVGFSSAANFATAFRDRFGCTPSACRSSQGVDIHPSAAPPGDANARGAVVPTGRIRRAASGADPRLRLRRRAASPESA